MGTVLKLPWKLN